MRKYFPQGVLWCKKPEREHGARQPLPLTAAVFFCLRGYAAQSRKARCKKQPERRARLFLCPHAAEQAANGWSPQPCPTTSRLCRAIAQSAMQKTAGAPSEAVSLSSRRRTGGEWLEPATLPHHEQAMPPHTPLKHPAMSLLCIHIPQNSCTIFVILLCRG